MVVTVRTKIQTKVMMISWKSVMMSPMTVITVVRWRIIKKPDLIMIS